ncbi:hypothetical protein [Lamprobacter sp.]|uniref:hypothetical protein n=1 Tax=Lamprobacter sp. TaxID=3100796 RepID=UPI003A4DECD5
MGAPITACAPSSSAAPAENRPKAQDFRRSNNKLADADLLTPEGIEQKTRILARFLKRKEAEYQALQAELEQLTAEAKAEGLLDPESAKP